MECLSRQAKRFVRTRQIALLAAVAALLAAPVALFADDPYAYPVPYNAAKDDTNQGIVFTNLPNTGSIKIYTINGEEVADLSIDQGQLSKSWSPVVTSSGRKVASGVYFWMVIGGGASFTGKIVVIR